MGKRPFPFGGRSAIVIRQDMSPHVQALLQKGVIVLGNNGNTACHLEKLDIVGFMIDCPTNNMSPTGKIAVLSILR